MTHLYWVALKSIWAKEINRFMRIWVQTLVPPVITMTLYFIIFGNLIGSRIGEMHGFTYMQFIVPGLIMMAVITNAYANVASSFFSAKFQRNIEELLVAPVPTHVIIAGYVGGGVARGLCVGILVTAISLFFVPFQVHSWLFVALTLLLGTRDYNGAGMDVIARALWGDVSGWAWLWKLLFTAVTIGCGFKGGEVVPSFFVGAAFGCFMGGLLGLPAGFAAAIGLVAVFCGAVNCPVASVLLSVELFGSAGAPYFAVACALSYLLSGYCGLYSSQTILYSKLRAEFINVRTHE